MQRIRATVRLAAIVASTTILYAIYVAGRALRRGSRAWRNRMVRLWARTLSRLLGMRSRVEGPRPAGSFLMVANHVSYVDILLLAQHLDVVFVARSDMRQWPGIGLLAASVGTIFIDRASRRDAVRVGMIVEEAVRAGAGVVLFPEATSSDGRDVLPFKPALLAGAARDGVAVHHAAIRYEPADVAWFGDMELLPHLWSLLQIERLDASLQFGGAVVASDRKELAEKLWREVRARIAAH
jgi:1-acyl-sn-glycerol-3-phosphate acyltransferase